MKKGYKILAGSLALVGSLALAGAASTQAGSSFWYFIYSKPGQQVFNSRSYPSQEECSAGADRKYRFGFDVSNCRDSDNPAASQD